MNYTLKYGCNPHQGNANLAINSDPGPFQILNGQPSYINILDSLYSWQLVKELDAATGKPSAASFKHVSPAGAAISGSISDSFRKSQFLENREYSSIASAYIRARGGDRMCSYGDAAAVSRTVDMDLASILKTEVCDLIIAPDYEPDALEMLRSKKKGAFIILKIDPSYSPDIIESREVFGFTLQQSRNNAVISKNDFNNVVSEKNDTTQDILETLLVATIALKYTQSNSVSVAYEGPTLPQKVSRL